MAGLAGVRFRAGGHAVPIDQAASWLRVPYLCWVTFAGALNFAAWRMNIGRPIER
jgi:tryptophan-rich sensory protein